MTQNKKPSRRTSKRPLSTLSRRDARQRAVSILYESKIKDISAMDVALSEGLKAIDPLTFYLVDGVVQALDEIDEIIGRLSTKWEFARLPIVEVCVLEIGIFELLDAKNNQAIVINEAVELAKQLSEPKAGRYINGILSAVADEYLPESALPESALPESALPESALPESALPESALPESN